MMRLLIIDYILAEKKLKKIVEQYEELKESGKLKKYIEKKRKSNSRKDFFKISDQ